MRAGSFRPPSRSLRRSNTAFETNSGHLVPWMVISDSWYHLQPTPPQHRPLREGDASHPSRRSRWTGHHLDARVGTQVGGSPVQGFVVQLTQHVVENPEHGRHEGCGAVDPRCKVSSKTVLHCLHFGAKPILYVAEVLLRRRGDIQVRSEDRRRSRSPQ